MKALSIRVILIGCVVAGFCFSPATLAAQESFSDQMRQTELAWEKGVLSPEALVKQRLELAQKFKVTQPDSVVQMLAQTRSFCQQRKLVMAEADVLQTMGNTYELKRMFDEAETYYNLGLQLARKAKYTGMEARLLNSIGSVFLYRGNYPQAMNYFLDALKIAEATNNKFVEGIVLNNLANLYYFQDKMEFAERHYLESLHLTQAIDDTLGLVYAYNNLGEFYLKTKEYLKALQNLQGAYKQALAYNIIEVELASGVALGEVYTALDSLATAEKYLEKTRKQALEVNDPLYLVKALLAYAALDQKRGGYDAALQKAASANVISRQIGQNQLSAEGYRMLSELYEAKGDGMLALHNYKMYRQQADSLNNLENERKVTLLEAEYNYSKKETDFQKKTYTQRLLFFSALAALFSMGVIALIINRNKRRLNKANLVLQEKNREIEEQKDKLEQALEKLKATQGQLIHSEKMASLGELTAGIAHEIQNPLNFVKNFSEVSKELLDELSEEVDKKNYDDVKAIAADVVQNLEKINHHGKRADAIVKGMLQHSRNRSGKKEPTDINALCDEYLRLAFHGYKAKQKDFSAGFEKEWDPTIGDIEIVAQDIGRVVLNLINNAFYAVNDKQKTAGTDYRPMVRVTTKQTDEGVVIKIADNGNGIPDAIREKIFQPFFTTKPSGEGTGLGLSLSFDIVSNGHGGKLLLDTVPGEKTVFTIVLPVGRAVQ